jgi:hypothetical protein
MTIEELRKERVPNQPAWLKSDFTPEQDDFVKRFRSLPKHSLKGDEYEVISNYYQNENPIWKEMRAKNQGMFGGAWSDDDPDEEYHRPKKEKDERDYEAEFVDFLERLKGVLKGVLTTKEISLIINDYNKHLPEWKKQYEEGKFAEIGMAD